MKRYSNSSDSNPHEGGTLLLIPAFNAAKSLRELVERASRFTSRDNILIVDDGSTDNTFEVAKSCETRLLKHEANQGKGIALRNGFDYALENGYAAVLTMDSDLQHAPEDLPGFFSTAETGRFDIIVGTRLRCKPMPWLRAVSNFVTSAIISLFAYARISDTQSGYRWISTDILRRLSLIGKGYDMESEMLLKAGRMGARIGQVRIQTIYESSVSYIHPIRDSIKFWRIIIGSIFW